MIYENYLTAAQKSYKIFIFSDEHCKNSPGVSDYLLFGAGHIARLQ
jgi:hypothetical protein